jgi:aspartate racemase
VLINSIDLDRMIGMVSSQALDALSAYLSEEIQRLSRAGAHLALLASNTPHIVFDSLRERSPIPLISIVEAACSAARTLGLKRPGLIGTRFTMQGSFYPEVFSRQGISLVKRARPTRRSFTTNTWASLRRACFQLRLATASSRSPDA